MAATIVTHAQVAAAVYWLATWASEMASLMCKQQCDE